MDVVWLRGDDEAPSQQGWFIHLGNGQNIRRADLPLTLSKKQARHFLSAPSTTRQKKPCAALRHSATAVANYWPTPLLARVWAAVLQTRRPGTRSCCSLSASMTST
jgi:hypothetical protein